MKEGIRWCPHCREPHALASRFCPNTGDAIDGQLHETPAQPIGVQHPLTGTVLDRDYEIRRRIGTGGMNEVFEAKDRTTGRSVAIKIVKDKTPEGAARLVRESEIVASIKHENICAIHGVGTMPDGRPYLVLERLEGETLETTLHGGRRLSSDSAIAVFKQVLAGLACAHERGIIHRDIKPSNIFLVDRGAQRPLVKVLDFGLAFDSIRRGARMTRPGKAAGTPRYMAPEQLLGGAVGPETDLFTVSLVLYESLAGAHPFAATTLKQIGYNILHESEPDLGERRKKLPFGLTAIVHAGLAKRMADRPRSALAMLHSLERVDDIEEEPDSSDTYDSHGAPLVRF